jgi:hypothetical protein
MPRNNRTEVLQRRVATVRSKQKMSEQIRQQRAEIERRAQEADPTYGLNEDAQGHLNFSLREVWPK